MICSSCNQRAFALRPDGTCTKCQPIAVDPEPATDSDAPKSPGRPPIKNRNGLPPWPHRTMPEKERRPLVLEYYRFYKGVEAGKFVIHHKGLFWYTERRPGQWAEFQHAKIYKSRRLAQKSLNAIGCGEVLELKESEKEVIK